jgi:hypothetical protein
MKYVKNLFIGAFLAILGIMMFLQKLTFTDPSNTGMFGDIFGQLFGQTSPKAVSGVMFVLIFIMLLLFAFSPNFLTLAGLIISILAMVFVVVSSLEISVATMSGLELGIILTLVIVGIGLAGRSAVMLVIPDNKKYS